VNNIYLVNCGAKLTQTRLHVDSWDWLSLLKATFLSPHYLH